jgi:hypothetical protein
MWSPGENADCTRKIVDYGGEGGGVIMRLRTELLQNAFPVSRTPLGAFAKLREATIDFITSVRLFGTNVSHVIDFHEV